MKSEKIISDLFETVVEQCLQLDKTGKSSNYMDGIRAALGWALEEYEDSPLD